MRLCDICVIGNEILFIVLCEHVWKAQSFAPEWIRDSITYVHSNCKYRFHLRALGAPRNCTPSSGRAATGLVLHVGNAATRNPPTVRIREIFTRYVMMATPSATRCQLGVAPWITSRVGLCNTHHFYRYLQQVCTQ